jgi:ABC-type transporter Mla subunit MlaD
MKRHYLAAIGFMVILALALLTRALLFLHPTPGDEAFILHVRFQNVDKISPGTRVTFAGKAVGEVKTVELLPEAFAPRVKSNELIYPYELKLAVDSSVKLYKSDDILVKTAGLMGEHFIAIIPRPVLHESDLHPVGADDILFATQAGSVEDTFGEISTVAKKADQTMEALISLIEKNQEGIFKTTEAVHKAADELDLLLHTINTSNGTLSKLVKDPHLYDELTASAQKINMLVSDIQTYGMLFQHNRDWQREAFRRKQETQALCLNTTEHELTKVATAIQSLNQSMGSIKESLESGNLSKDKTQQRMVRVGIQSLQQDLGALQETVKNLNLAPDEQICQDN